MPLSDTLRARLLILAALFAGGVACVGAAQSYDDLNAPLTKEIERLQGVLKGIDPDSLPEEVRDMVAGSQAGLDKTRATASPLLRLYRLRDPFINVETVAFVADHKAPGQNLQSFETLWRERESRFAERRSPSRGWLLQTALQQAAGNKAEKLFRASLPYAKVSSPFAGVYYLGEAEANRNFRKFVESLPAREDRVKAPTRDDLNRAWTSLETETLALFEKDPASPTAIPVSARLKEARELLDQGLPEGATLSLLETRLGLSRRQALEEKKGSASPEIPRDSIGALYSEMLKDPDAETARLVRSSVLPLYASLARSRS